MYHQYCSHICQSLRKSKLREYINLGIIIAVVFLVYFLYLIFRPFGFSDEISITFGENDIEGLSPDFYINQNNTLNGVVSPQMIENDVSYRNLYGTTTYFTFRPKRYLPDVEKLSFSLDLRAMGADMFIEIPCKECDGKTPEIPVYLNGLEDYSGKITLGSEKFPAYFYSKENLVVSPGSSEYIEQWIQENVPSGTPVLITGELLKTLDLNKLANPLLDFDANKITTLTPTFFAGQKFFVQSPNQLQIGFTKTNSNHLSGSDALSVQILDLNDSLIAEKVFADDGITEGGAKSTEQKFSISLDLPAKGIYQLYFKPTENTDFELNDITVNTNKIVFQEGQIKGDNTLFGKVNAPGILQIISHEKNDSGIQLSGETQIDLPIKYINKTINVAIESGAFELSTQSLLTLKNAIFSENADTFFLPYSIELRTLGQTDNVLTRMDLYEIDEGILHGSNYFIKNELQSLKAKADLKEIPVQIRLHFPPDQEEIYRILGNRNYISDFCGFTLYSIQNNPPVAQNETTCEKDNLIQLIKDIIPADEKVDFVTGQLQENDFYEVSGIEDYQSESNELTINLRGNSKFAFYIQGDLNMTISKIDLNSFGGRDDITVSILDKDNRVIYTDTIEDDVNTGNNNKVSTPIEKTLRLNRLSGLYFLTFEESVQRGGSADYLIEEIAINTNKFISIGGGIIFQPTSLFFNNRRPDNVNFHFWYNNPQDILVDDDDSRTIVFTTENNRISTPVPFEAGLHKIETTGGQIRIFNNNFAFSDDGYFNFSPYSQGADYILIDNMEPFEFSLYQFSVKY